MQSFPCYQCGKCCRNVDKSESTRFLDRGDGICHHLNLSTNYCRIYSNRPDICRIDLQYIRHYSDQYSWDAFVEINLIACEKLGNESELLI